jgi:hypothetical protein
LQWLARVYPDLFALTTTLDQAAKRTPKQRARAKKLGMKRGFSDIAIFWPTPTSHGLFIEFKRPASPGKPAGKLSKSQKEVFALLRDKGYTVCTCYDWLTARAATELYLG